MVRRSRGLTWKKDMKKEQLSALFGGLLKFAGALHRKLELPQMKRKGGGGGGGPSVTAS